MTNTIIIQVNFIVCQEHFWREHVQYKKYYPFGSFYSISLLLVCCCFVAVPLLFRNGNETKQERTFVVAKWEMFFRHVLYMYVRTYIRTYKNW